MLLKLLIVDEDVELRSNIIRNSCWNRLGVYICGEASNGQEGLNAIKLLHPDIVMTNVQLKVMNGLEMIREGHKEVDFKTVVITNVKNFDYLKRAMDMGIDSRSFFVNPVKRCELEKEIIRLKSVIINTYSWKIKMANNNELAMYALEYIKKNYNKQIRLTDIAEQKNISTDHYRRIIKKYMGESFVTILNKYRVGIALNLKKEGCTMRTIAEKTGFENYKRLVYNLKKYVGNCNI